MQITIRNKIAEFYIKYTRINKRRQFMKNILEVKNVGKKYQNKEDEIQALKNVNFRIKLNLML